MGTVQKNSELDAALTMRAIIQKIATGPEYSKDLDFDEARAGMRLILEGKADPVQAGIFFIALRMKRETDAENRGILQAILDVAPPTEAPVDELFDVADPYDGFTRSVPASPFLPAVLAAAGVPAVTHGLESVGPKFGVTPRKVLRAAGIDVDLDPAAAAAQVGDIGWAYLDQRHYCPPLHGLLPLRQRMVKRQVMTTVEVLLGPLRGRRATHLITGYVHKAYPPVYAALARQAGFDSALIVRGVEGGITPSLQQPGRLFFYRERGEERLLELDPAALDIQQASRAVPVPADLPAAAAGDRVAAAIDSDALAAHAATLGRRALQGERGPTYDSLVYTGALCLAHLGRADSLAEAAQRIRGILDSGAAHERLEAARKA